MSTRLRWLSVLATALAGACSSPPDDPNPGDPDADIVITPDAAVGDPDASVEVPEDIRDFLDTVPGLTYDEITTEYPGYRAFYIDFTQPVNHAAPGKQFQQRMVLHHRDRGAPMILYTSGYSLFSLDYLSELAASMGANQVSTEQRFFGTSKPDPLAPADWDHVTIQQAATDHHRVVQALAPYYDKAWLSTGHSKGGMTSIYHRRFFPDDVDATVPYVAPISFGAPDYRYLPFFDAVADATCRNALRAAQIEALNRFDAMLSRAQAIAKTEGLTFARSGGQAAAFEGDIAGIEWSFWQYAGWNSCDSIPPTSASDDALFEFVRNTAGVGSSDQTIAFFETYFYQAVAQLGYPVSPYEHLDGLLNHSGVASDILPAGTSPVYDDAAMPDIADWVDGEGSEIVFVYGEYDPWYGGAFDPGGATDTYLTVAPQRNHGALISDLPATQRAQALDAIEAWTGVRPAIGTAFAAPIRRPVIPRLPPPRVIGVGE
jgi:hypothetical protein